jgi:starch synthase (maltosyl-transferring)
MPRAAKSARKTSAVAPPSGAAPRAIIENVQPDIDAGRFPAKRVQGETVLVEADVFADGHDKVAADLLYRYAGLRRDAAPATAKWTRVPMTPTENDRWAASFTVEKLGYYEFTIEGWVDVFATWRDGLSKKFGAGQDVALELKEGAEWCR